MTNETGHQPEVVIDLNIPTVKPFKVTSHDAYIVEDLIQHACEIVGVAPTFR